jgi:hypothetical protein
LVLTGFRENGVGGFDLGRRAAAPNVYGPRPATCDGIPYHVRALGSRTRRLKAMPRIPDEDIERIKRETDLAALARARGIELAPQGAHDGA